MCIIKLIENKVLYTKDINDVACSSQSHKLVFKNCCIDLTKGAVTKFVIDTLNNCILEGVRIYHKPSALDKILKIRILKPKYISNSTVLNDTLLFFGNNLGNIPSEILSVLDFSGSDLRNYVIPSDKYFFQKIKDKNLAFSRLPCFDTDQYLLEGVVWDNCIFHPLTRISNYFFSNARKHLVAGCTLPIIDFSKISLVNISFYMCKFHQDTIFKEEDYFFSNSPSVYGCVFPGQDYTKYKFKNNVSFCKFLKKSYFAPTEKICLALSNIIPADNFTNIHMEISDNQKLLMLSEQPNITLNEYQKNIIILRALHETY